MTTASPIHRVLSGLAGIALVLCFSTRAGATPVNIFLEADHRSADLNLSDDALRTALEGGIHQALEQLASRAALSLIPRVKISVARNKIPGTSSPLVTLRAVSQGSLRSMQEEFTSILKGFTPPSPPTPGGNTHSGSGDIVTGIKNLTIKIPRGLIDIAFSVILEQDNVECRFEPEPHIFETIGQLHQQLAQDPAHGVTGILAAVVAASMSDQGQKEGAAKLLEQLPEGGFSCPILNIRLARVAREARRFQTAESLITRAEDPNADTSIATLRRSRLAEDYQENCVAKDGVLASTRDLCREFSATIDELKRQKACALNREAEGVCRKLLYDIDFSREIAIGGVRNLIDGERYALAKDLLGRGAHFDFSLIVRAAAFGDSYSPMIAGGAVHFLFQEHGSLAGLGFEIEAGTDDWQANDARGLRTRDYLLSGFGNWPIRNSHVFSWTQKIMVGAHRTGSETSSGIILGGEVGIQAHLIGPVFVCLSGGGTVISTDDDVRKQKFAPHLSLGTVIRTF